MPRDAKSPAKMPTPSSIRKRGEKGATVPRWTPEEEAELRKIMSGGKTMSWPDVADTLGTGRTSQAVAVGSL